MCIWMTTNSHPVCVCEKSFINRVSFFPVLQSRTVAEELLTVTKKPSKNSSLSKMTEDISNG
jgi:hypothetical protein